MKKRIKDYIKKIDEMLNMPSEDIDWEKEAKEHLRQISFFMHERLIHLIVTSLFAILAVMVFLFLLTEFVPGAAVLFVALIALLIPYIGHYYLLENSVQYMYEQYDRMIENISLKNRTERGCL
ncbi:MAG: hypothetical protein K6G81_12920 [Lachnospiraceae bacterium]|nr:hypothetical protein [Lachnospiraceae bacterium]